MPDSSARIFILQWLTSGRGDIINLDKLTYASGRNNLGQQDHHTLVVGDIADRELVPTLLRRYAPKAIVNFAAESHVDRSIYTPIDVVNTNIVGTFHLLESTRLYWTGLNQQEKSNFRFIHVSTDEVYGSLGPADPPFSERTAYAPNSPYAASKAAADHLVRAWHHTYGLPVITVNCSNNYGPYQYPEKLIPLMVCNAVSGKPLPLYGDGQQIRDWLFVSDCCSAIQSVLERGQLGGQYCIAGRNEKTNQQIVETICEILDLERPRSKGTLYRDLIKFVADRPGHDRRYALDCSKIEQELGWRAQETFDSGIRKPSIGICKIPSGCRRRPGVPIATGLKPIIRAARPKKNGTAI